MSRMRERATKGVFWVGSTNILRQLMQVVTLVIIARLLSPDDFGLMALALMCVRLLMEAQEMGLGAALIQRQQVEQRHYATIFWAGLGFSLIIWGVLFLAMAPAASAFFRAPALTPMLRVLSASLILNALCNIHRNWLRRHLDFRALGLAEVGMVAAYSLTAIVCALRGLGVWSLVWAQLAGDVAVLLGVWARCPWRPTIEFERRAFGELFGFGCHVMATDVVGFAVSRVDTLLVGRFLGTALLGIYDMAKQIVTLPARKLSQIINEVTFPMFSKVQHEDAILARWYLMTVRSVSLLTIPLLSGLFVMAPDLIILVLGEKWHATIIPVRWLCFVGMMYSIGPIVSSLFRAKGRPDLQFKMVLVNLFAGTLITWYCAQYDINVVAMGRFWFGIIMVSVFWSLAHRLIRLKFSIYMRALAPAFVSSFVMGNLVFVARKAAIGRLGTVTIPLCAGLVVFGAVSYLITVWIISPHIVRENVKLIRETLSNVPMFSRLKPIEGAR